MEILMEKINFEKSILEFFKVNIFLMKSIKSNFNLRSSDSNLVLNYLITRMSKKVPNQETGLEDRGSLKVLKDTKLILNS